MPTGIATFGASANTNISVATEFEVDSWIFTSASNYTITFSPNPGLHEFNGTGVGSGIIVNGGSVNIINNGSVSFNSNTSWIAGDVTIVNNAFMILPNISDSVAITNNSVVLFWGNTNGANIINNGAVTYINDSSADNSTITNKGALAFIDHSNPDNAAITNVGPAVTDFGLTVGPNGNRKITVGSIAGEGTFRLGTSELTVGGNDLSTIVTGAVMDGGLEPQGGASLVKVGTGTLTLAGINTYTGATTVNAGALVVDGSTALSSLTTVNAGGTLAGIGTVGNTAIAGGTLAPGSAGGSVFGPLTVAGNLSFTAASTYMIQVSPTTAGLTNVTGAATLDGASVRAVFLPGTYVNKQYTILTATGGLGGTTFDPTVLSNNPNLNATLSYDANNVFLSINLDFATPSGPLTVNQQNVANALSNFFNTNGGIPGVFASLNAAGLTIASGELGTGIIQSAVKADDLFLNLLLDTTAAGRAGGFAPANGTTRFAAEDDAIGYAAKRPATPSERAAYAMATKAPRLLAAQPASRWSVWGAGYGGSATIDGNAVVGSQNTTARTWGVVASADYKVTPNALLGFALAGGGTNYLLANGLGHGSSDLFQAGAFGRHNFDPAYVSAALGYGWHDVTTNRTVALAGIDLLQARFRAETFSGRFEAGYRYANPLVGLTPYLAAQAISFRLPAYAEQVLAGAGLFALNYADQTTTATRTELGLRTDKSFAMRDGVLTLRGRAAWAHDYNNDRAVTAVFQALPGAAFVVNGARQPNDLALVTGAAEWKWLNGFSVAGTFEGEFSNTSRSYAGKGVVRYNW